MQCKIENAINISKNLTLDLNGFTVTQTAEESVITISSGKTFTLTDSSTAKTGTITGGKAYRGGGVFMGRNCTFNMTGGTIYDCSATSEGGGIYANGGTVNVGDENSSANILNNNAENGGGVHVNPNVDFTLTNASIQYNSASVSAGGIYAGNTIKVSETPNVSGNLISSGKEISDKDKENIVKSNIYLPSGKTISIIGDGIGHYMGPNGQIKCELYVTAENGTASITGACANYSKYFFSDNDAYAPKYGDGLIKLVEAYKVTFEWEDNYTIVVPVPKNDTVTVPEGEPPKDGYYFVGWLLDGKDYDLSQPVTSDITLTPKWVKSGETAVSVNHESFYVADLHEPATVYLAAYKDGVLIDLWSGTPEFDPDYPYLFSKTIAETGLDTSQADKITVFLWGENLQSKCGSETVIK